jgi:hypothetical protein
MNPTTRVATVALSLAVAVLALTAVACGDGGSGSTSSPTATAQSSPLPQGSEPVTLDPADFTTTIDNPYWPMRPGSRWVYRETDGKGGTQRVETTVTSDTKTIMGIEARVVHDVVTEDGQLVEDTLDWYAQDAQGNIWYLGEDTKEYENGKVKTTAGSWEAGVDGAQPGVLLPTYPQPGMAYRQEYYAGEAEDEAEVLSVTERVGVPYGPFENVLMTRDSTPLDPALVEHKFYAPGVGLVLVLATSGGSGREELIRFEPGR